VKRQQRPAGQSIKGVLIGRKETAMPKETKGSKDLPLSDATVTVILRKNETIAYVEGHPTITARLEREDANGALGALLRSFKEHFGIKEIDFEDERPTGTWRPGDASR
jgi:hypothetical protein